MPRSRLSQVDAEAGQQPAVADVYFDLLGPDLQGRAVNGYADLDAPIGVETG